MIDKSDWRIPYTANLRSDFRFIEKELRYAGLYGTVRRSTHYQGVCDLRPFGIDAILHLYFRGRGEKNHKLEIVDAGEKSIDQMAQIIDCVFDIDPFKLHAMRLDFAADMFGVPVTHLYESLRVKFKRSSDQRGELDYEVVGGRRLEYFRYGKAPNCHRVYDKPAECLARLPAILKRVSPDAELPTYDEVFGFPKETVLTRVERQAGGGRIPPEVATFRQLYRADEFNPFTNVEIAERDFIFPDPRHYGNARSLKLIGIREFVEKFGYQTARSMLNSEGNAKRIMGDYDAYQRETSPVTNLTIESIIEAYQTSVRKQIAGVKRPPSGISNRVCILTP